MAKYTITCACGHTITEQLYGKHSERDRRIAWRANNDCPTCWQANKLAEEKATKIDVAGKYKMPNGEIASVSIVDGDLVEITGLDNGEIKTKKIKIENFLKIKKQLEKVG